MAMVLVQSLLAPSKNTQGADNESCYSDILSVIEEETDEESIEETDEESIEENVKKDLVKSFPVVELEVEQTIQHRLKEFAQSAQVCPSRCINGAENESHHSSFSLNEETDEETDQSRSERKTSPKSPLVVAPEDQQSVQQEQLELKMSSALQEAVKEGMDLDLYTDLLLENCDKVKRKLQDHKLHLQRLLEWHHQQQMDVFKKLYQQMLQQILVAKTEGKNYEARLADLQHRVDEMLPNTERGKEPEKSYDELTGKVLTGLSHSFLQLLLEKPIVQVGRKTVKADLPDVAFEDLQELMGSVALWEDKDPLSDAPEPQQEFCDYQQCGTSVNGVPTPAQTPEHLPERMSQGLMGSVAVWKDKDPLSDTPEPQQECCDCQQCGTSINGVPTPAQTSEHLPERMSQGLMADAPEPQQECCDCQQCGTSINGVPTPAQTSEHLPQRMSQGLMADAPEPQQECCDCQQCGTSINGVPTPAQTSEHLPERMSQGLMPQQELCDCQQCGTSVNGVPSPAETPQHLPERMSQGLMADAPEPQQECCDCQQCGTSINGVPTPAETPQHLPERMSPKHVCKTLTENFSDPGDEGRMSGSSCPQILHEQMPETRSDSGVEDVTSRSSLPAGFLSQSASSLHIGGASFASAPLIYTATESTTLATAERWFHHEQVKQENIICFPEDPSQKEQQNSYWCKSSTPTEQKRNICKRGPLSEQNKILGRETIQSRCRELLALEAADTSTARPHKWTSVTTPPGSSPIRLSGRWIEPSAIAPRCDGKMWVCYTSQGLLDLVDESGAVCQSTHIGRSPKHLAAYGPGDVLVAHDSPQSLMLYTDGQERHALFGKCKYQAIAATTSGIVVSSKIHGRNGCKLFWVPLESDTTWVRVSHPHVHLKSVCSLAVMTYNGKNVICAADKGRRLVHFLQQEISGQFTAHPSFGYDGEENFMNQKSLRRRGRDPTECKYFTPVSVSAHPSGFVAVLDAAMASVHFIDTRKLFEWGLNGSQCTTSVIAWDRLTYGVPRMIAFSAGEHGENEAKLWVGVTSGHLCVVPLLFLSW